MRAEFVNPFLASLMNVLKTMASLELKPQKPRIKKDIIIKMNIFFFWNFSINNLSGSMEKIQNYGNSEYRYFVSSIGYE